MCTTSIQDVGQTGGIVRIYSTSKAHIHVAQRKFSKNYLEVHAHIIILIFQNVIVITTFITLSRLIWGLIGPSRVMRITSGYIQIQCRACLPHVSIDMRSAIVCISDMLLVHLLVDNIVAMINRQLNFFYNLIQTLLVSNP